MPLSSTPQYWSSLQKAGAHGDRATGWRVAERIVDQVVEHFGEQRFVAQNARRLEVEAEIDVASDCGRNPLRADAFGHRAQVDGDEALRVGARLLGAGQCQQAIGELAGSQHGIAHLAQCNAQ